MKNSASIIYVQYTNLIAYPPLVNSSRILTHLGWTVRSIGLEPLRASHQFDPEQHKFISMTMTQPAPGWRQKIHYLRFCLWTVLQLLRFRPTWVYSSDLYSVPPAFFAALLLGCKIIYHEHDYVEPQSVFLRLLNSCRNKLCSKAEIVITPNQERGRQLVEETGIPEERHICVWNCTPQSEAEERHLADTNGINLIYQGSLSKDRLPFTIIEAMKQLPETNLWIVGYETSGTGNLLDEFTQTAKAAGIEQRVKFLGHKSRTELQQITRTAHIGLCLINPESNDNNLRNLVGASNKVFEYLAAGCAVLVADQDDWQNLISNKNLGAVCDPADSESICAAISQLTENLPECASNAVRIIQTEWNYENQFQPALDRLEASNN